MLEALATRAHRWWPRLIRALAVLFLPVLVIGGFATLDEVFTPPPPADVGSYYAPDGEGGRAVELHPGSRRAFLLMIDSLPWEVASDRKQMPELVERTKTGVVAQMKASNDAVTVPALRAAFTGRDNFRIFGFVGNLLRGEMDLDSWFTQVRNSGLTIGVYSDNAFKQFSRDIEIYGSNGARHGEGDRQSQKKTLDKAIKAYLDHKTDIVIFHLSYGDHVSHAHRRGSKAYKDAFRAIDKMVTNLAEKIPAEDTLFVFGDHGHNERGVHTMGIDVPTYLFVRGPGFAPGTVLETMPLTDFRYFASWAVQVPMAPDAHSAAHPEALRPIGGAEPQQDYRERTVATEATTKGWPLELGVLALCVGAATSVWLAGIRHGRLPLQAAATAAIGTLLLSPLTPLGSSLGLALGGAIVARELARARRQPKELLWLLAPVVSGLYFLFWGELFADIRPLIHWTALAKVRNAQLAVVAVLLAASLLFGPRRGLIGLFVIGGLLAYPTIYRYGAMPAMAPIWFAWLLIVGGAAALHASRNTTGSRRVVTVAAIVLGVVAVALLIQEFAAVHTTNFKFRSWKPLVPALTIKGDAWIWAALAGKAVVLLRWRNRWWVTLVTVALLALDYCVDAGIGPLRKHELVVAGVAAALGVCALLAPRLGEGGRELRWVCGLIAADLALMYSLRTGTAWHGWLGVGLCAFSLSARLAAELPDDLRRAAWIGLTLLGVAFAGWVGFDWAMQRFEWTFIYDLVSPQRAIEVAPVLVPFVVVRFLIPMWMIRAVLRERLLATGPEPRSTTRMLVGMKLASLVLLAGGLATALPGGSIYLEGVQQSGILLLLLAAL